MISFFSIYSPFTAESLDYRIALNYEINEYKGAYFSIFGLIVLDYIKILCALLGFLAIRQRSTKIINFYFIIMIFIFIMRIVLVIMLFCFYNQIEIILLKQRISEKLYKNFLGSAIIFCLVDIVIIFLLLQQTKKSKGEYFSNH